jgi:hypothetical protein
MSNKRFLGKRFLFVAATFVVLLFAFSLRDSAKGQIREILNSSWTPAAIWVLSITATLADRVFVTTPSTYVDINGKFKYFADAVFNAATFGFAGSTSVALLNALYQQAIFNQQNFSGFGNFDLASIFVVSSFLLFYSLNGMIAMIAAAIFQAEAIPIEV